MPEPLVVATIAMSVASLIISGLSIRWSLKSRRSQREIERIRSQRVRARGGEQDA